MLDETCEDCLVNILRLTDGSGQCTVPDLAVLMKKPFAETTDILGTLGGLGYVSTSADGMNTELTATGLEIAKEIHKKHHIMEKFLVEVLDIDEKTAHEEACRMEHRLSNDSTKRLCGIIGGTGEKDCSRCPVSCPTICLDDMENGDTGKIHHIKGRTPEDVRKLISMGFIPGRELRYEGRVSENGPRIIIIGDSTIALDSSLTSEIFMDVGTK